MHSSVEKDSIRLLMQKPGPGYWAVVSLLLLTIGVGLTAWIIQLRTGLGVTGLSSQVMWGVYIVNFVFFIGISHAGTLVSAILRILGVEWRYPITRVAELVTVVALMIGGAMIFADIGRPGLAPVNMLRFAQASSPLIWDMTVLITYLAGATFFLYIPLIPDIARCRDAYRKIGGLRYRFYKKLALGWVGAPMQERMLEKAMTIMTIVIIPIAVMAHSVVSWIFGMTLRPGWDSTIFAPYFVVGAIFSGTAVLIVVMAFYRRFFGLQAYFTVERFVKLGYILLSVNIAYMYFTFSEYLTIGYKVKEGYHGLLGATFVGSHAPYFWFFVILGMVLPALLIVLPRTRTISGLTVASLLVIIGTWLKRWIIVVTPLENTFTPAGIGAYSPTWIEWSITAAGFAALALAFLIFQRFFPIIPIWEVEHGAQKAREEGAHKGDWLTVVQR